MTDRGLTRRGVLTAGAVGAGALVLGACSSKKKTTTPAAGATNPSPSEDSGGSAGGKNIAKVSDIPVGDSISSTIDGKPVMLFRPTAGTVVCFTRICTHRGCKVDPAGKEFHCPCHGSIYDAATGAVKSGLAPAPLAKIPVHVVGGEVVSGA